jgi:hypothetical protein
VADALIHVDPENDSLNPPPVKFAARAVVSEAARQALCAQGLSLESLGLHYPSGGFGIDIVLPGELSESEVEAGDFEGLKRQPCAREIRIAQSMSVARQLEAQQCLPGRPSLSWLDNEMKCRSARRLMTTRRVRRHRTRSGLRRNLTPAACDTTPSHNGNCVSNLISLNTTLVRTCATAGILKIRSWRKAS